MIIVFHTPSLTFRGSGVALYDYAHYTELLYGYTSLILTVQTSNHDDIAFKWFHNRFRVHVYDGTREHLECVLDDVGASVLYTIKYGTNDGVYSTRTHTVVHCVFDMSEPHGDVYAGVSETLSRKYGQGAHVPHMVRTPTPFELKRAEGVLRSELGIPTNALVFGRHGGRDTFNLQFVKEAISEIVRLRSDIYFLFMNAPEWDMHRQIVYLPATTDGTVKHEFICACDAMIVPETLGHTFGLSIAEFSVRQKPVLCYNGEDVWNRAHIDMLGDVGIYFKTKSEFIYIINTFSPCPSSSLDLNMYTKYNPLEVMRMFKRVFLDSACSRRPSYPSTSSRTPTSSKISSSTSS
jgi:hypothetical protein